MHFVLLVEDQSGQTMLEFLLPKILGDEHTYKVHSYKGVGHIPKNLSTPLHARNKNLLNHLPRLLRGFGRQFANHQAAVVVVCDLDKRCLKQFRQALLALLADCHPAPDTHFCIAVEEGEAWLLGDPDAIKRAYPTAKDTGFWQMGNEWEALARVIDPKKADTLKKKGYPAVGEAKHLWAEAIAPHMNVEKNQDASFIYFRDTLRKIAAGPSSPKIKAQNL